MISGYANEEDWADAQPVETYESFNSEGAWPPNTDFAATYSELDTWEFNDYPVNNLEAYPDTSSHFTGDLGMRV